MTIQMKPVEQYFPVVLFFFFFAFMKIKFEIVFNFVSVVSNVALHLLC